MNDDFSICKQCEKEINTNTLDLVWHHWLGVCDECRTEYAICQCDYCQKVIALIPSDNIPEGASFPVPPERDHDHEEYYLCEECHPSYCEEYPNWEEFYDAPKDNDYNNDTSSDEDNDDEDNDAYDEAE